MPSTFYAPAIDESSALFMLYTFNAFMCDIGIILLEQNFHAPPNVKLAIAENN